MKNSIEINGVKKECENICEVSSTMLLHQTMTYALKYMEIGEHIPIDLLDKIKRHSSVLLELSKSVKE